MKPKEKFTGLLAKEIEPEFNLLALALDPDDAEMARALDEANADFGRQVIQKLPLLMEHFGISTDDPLAFEKLSIGLACRFVPGFRRARPGAPVGRPRNHDIFDIGLAVSDMVKRTGMSERSACFALAKRPEFSKYKEKPETLYRRYKLLKERYANDGTSITFVAQLIKKAPRRGAKTP